MNRRDFFKRAVGAAGALALTPLTSGRLMLPGITALQPIFEVGTPLPPSDLTLQEVIERSLEACARNESTWPGFTKGLHDALKIKLYGLPPVGLPSSYSPRPSMAEIAQSWIRALERHEAGHYPGLTRAIYDALTPRMVGLSVPDFYSALWRSREQPMDGWTHHAVALSEGLHP